MNIYMFRKVEIVLISNSAEEFIGVEGSLLKLVNAGNLKTV
jgi:hypothetical protein